MPQNNNYDFHQNLYVTRNHTNNYEKFSFIYKDIHTHTHTDVIKC